MTLRIQGTGSTGEGLDHEPLQLWVFLLLWPALNAVVVAAVMADMERFTLQGFLPIAGRLWLIFALSLAVIRPLQKALPRLLRPDQFWVQFALHAVVIIGAGALIGPAMAPPGSLNVELSLVAPRVFLLLEIAIYLGVLRLIAAREHIYAERLARQET
jgi:hypothetical protein